MQQAEQAAEICSQLSHRLSAGQADIGNGNQEIINAWCFSLEMVLSAYLIRSDSGCISLVAALDTPFDMTP